MKKQAGQVGLVLSILAMQAVFSTGCASIMSTTNYPVRLNSTPNGANVVVAKANGDVIHRGVTPMVCVLKSSSGYFSPAKYSLSFSKEGYRETTIPLNATLDPLYGGNCLFGGLLGLLIVDPATGAMWCLDDNISARLQSDAKKESSEQSSSDTQNNPQ